MKCIIPELVFTCSGQGERPDQYACSEPPPRWSVGRFGKWNATIATHGALSAAVAEFER
jgi:hypothetical protein